MTSIEDRVQRVFREVFDRPDIVITGGTTAADIPEWDSLEHINLVIALEEEFGIEFSSEEVTTMANVGDLYAALRARA